MLSAALPTHVYGPKGSAYHQRIVQYVLHLKPSLDSERFEACAYNSQTVFPTTVEGISEFWYGTYACGMPATGEVKVQSIRKLRRGPVCETESSVGDSGSDISLSLDAVPEQ
jgi:hypothetical protein